MKLLIVGADPSPAMKHALGQQLPGVTVTGSVPDVRPYIRGSALMVAPLAIARGTQNKILEAMAMGVPVVTSSVLPLAAWTPKRRQAPAWWPTRPQICRGGAARRRKTRQNAPDLRNSGRERMLSHHAWPMSMRGSTASSRAA